MKFLLFIFVFFNWFIFRELYSQVNHFEISTDSVKYKSARTDDNYKNTSVDFTSSNIPLIIIETNNGADISNEPKIDAHMKIIDNGPENRNQLTDQGNIYDGNIGIEIRGAYSASLPQKPYGFETRKDNDSNNNVPILGLPEENDWILLANYNDKVFLRNALAFYLFRQMGHYAPRTVHCELVLNGDYQGIYVLTEKIKIDKNRVNLANLDPDDNAGDSLTGGYIFKVDYYDPSISFTSKFPDENSGAVFFVYHDPKYNELTALQRNYISSFIQSFETVLYGKDFTDPIVGYRNYIDVYSFIDYFIIGELTRNVDVYKKSAYFFKDKDSKGGLLNCGPPWDYDWAWKNINECFFKATDGSGWAYKIHECPHSPNPPNWMVRLLQDTLFTNELHNRYYNLRNSLLSTENLFHYIDSVAAYLNEAQARHYEKWPILGINVGTPETDGQPTTFSGDITKFKNWISTRLSWLDANMPGYTELNNNISLLSDRVFRIFPNPASDFMYVESDAFIKSIEIYNPSGILVRNENTINKYSAELNISTLSPGIYLVRVIYDKAEFCTEKVIIK